MSLQPSAPSQASTVYPALPACSSLLPLLSPFSLSPLLPSFQVSLSSASLLELLFLSFLSVPAILSPKTNAKFCFRIFCTNYNRFLTSTKPKKVIDFRKIIFWSIVYITKKNYSAWLKNVWLTRAASRIYAFTTKVVRIMLLWLSFSRTGCLSFDRVFFPNILRMVRNTSLELFSH